MQLFRTILATPLGDMLALSSDQGLCALEFTTVEGPGARRGAADAPRRAAGEMVSSRTRSSTRDDDDDRAHARVADAATSPARSADIDAIAARHARRAVRDSASGRALRTIPPGQTTSYGAIAQALGAPGASRAVGAANGANPIAIIVPCHRVIGSSGSLTGYGGGLDRKTWLIEHERRWRTEPQASLF